MDPMDRRGAGSSPGMMGGGPGGGGVPGSGGQHHRSRSATRTASGAAAANRSYGHSLDRDGHDREREFMPIREGRDGRPDMRDRSLERGMDPGGMMAPSGGRRDRSMDRGAMMDEDMLYSGGVGGGVGGMGPGAGLAMPRSARQSPAVDMAMKGGAGVGSRETYLMEMQAQNSDLSRELQTLKRELEMTNQKLGSSMHSIKTFWSPELKKERALRKEESAKYSLINDQLKLLNAENQVFCLSRNAIESFRPFSSYYYSSQIPTGTIRFTLFKGFAERIDSKELLSRKMSTEMRRASASRGRSMISRETQRARPAAKWPAPFVSCAFHAPASRALRRRVGPDDDAGAASRSAEV